MAPRSTEDLDRVRPQTGSDVDLVGVHDTEIDHREVDRVVGEDHGPVCSCCPRDESVQRVDRAPSLCPLGLVAAGAAGALAIRLKEPQAVEQRLRALALAWSQTNRRGIPCWLDDRVRISGVVGAASGSSAAVNVFCGGRRGFRYRRVRYFVIRPDHIPSHLIRVTRLRAVALVSAVSQ